MDRLAEQVVAWHNSHPLAKQITIYDVHTIGVVALPFMRSGRAGAPAGSPGSAEPHGMIEPVLTDEVSPESLAEVWSGESTIAANTNAAHLDALADQEPLPASARLTWQQRLAQLLPWRRSGGGGSGAAMQAWPAFSERFVSGLSNRRIANFAKAHGYSKQPGDETWPQRVVPMDDALMAGKTAAGGAWPFEIYLMSAAIDAGRSRSRVLVGHGSVRTPIIGRRCLSPLRVGLLALLLLGLAGAALALLLPRGGAAGEHHAAADAASAPASAAPAAASAPAATASVASAPAPAAAAAASEAASAAEPAASSASAVEAAASAATAATTAAPAAAPEPPAEAPPDIRPNFVKPIPPRPGRPMLADAPVPAPAPAPAPATAPSAAAGQAAKPTPAEVKAGPRPAAAATGKPVVALVGPSSASKAEAEAMLARMRAMIAPNRADAGALQAQVFQTPEGWRPAVWPFASREEAQLINATLVARGMRTRALDF